MFTRYSFFRALLLRFSLAMLVQEFKTGEFSRQNVAC